ncbi:MAG: DUF4388 domain-containing protein [Deltaproteobacteria bacterium]|nr:DUF4388 domain-containing protein [Deltaproteobacteria bacterium]
MREGMIDEHDLEESLSRMKVRQMLQGEALVEMGSLSAKSLRLGLELQIEAKLLEIFTWPYGAFRFQPGEEVLPDEAELPVQVEELVRRGMLRFYPAEKVREEFDGLRNRQPACTDDRRLLQRPMGLTEEEQAFLHALDGSATAEQIVRHGGLSRDHAERLLLALLHVRRVQLLPRGSRLATPTAPAAAPR